MMSNEHGATRINILNQQSKSWLIYLLLPLVHFASVKITFLTAFSPEGEVVVWLPNAVLLAALLHFRNLRIGLLVCLTFSSDLIANLPVFPIYQAFALSACNVIEVMVAFNLLKNAEETLNFERIQNFGKFLIAGPVLGSLCGAFLAGCVLLTLDGNSASYFTLVLLWWYGDALGLLIFTPLLLFFLQTSQDLIDIKWWDTFVLLIAVVFAGLIFTNTGERQGDGLLLTPMVLLPFVLYIAVRLGTRWTSLAIALLALGTAWAQTTGNRPFGDASAHTMILRTQEFILLMSCVGMGVAILFGEQKHMTKGLEEKVRKRTQALEEANSKLLELSTTDSLTGIGNRRSFDQMLTKILARARRCTEPCTLAMLDVDFFKEYNDHYGHQSGDECLLLIAQVLAENMHRTDDFVARYGGDEFVIIMQGADIDATFGFFQELCQKLEDKKYPNEVSPIGLVTMSIGIASITPSEENASEKVLIWADKALYEAKKRGRNQVFSYGNSIVEVANIK
jgi:diguanylate cyclase (GGDEF)-like protein